MKILKIVQQTNENELTLLINIRQFLENNQAIGFLAKEEQLLPKNSTKSILTFHPFYCSQMPFYTMLYYLYPTGPKITSSHPPSMEEIGQNYGFLLYRKILLDVSGVTLSIKNLRDRAVVLVDEVCCFICKHNASFFHGILTEFRELLSVPSRGGGARTYLGKEVLMLRCSAF